MSEKRLGDINVKRPSNWQRYLEHSRNILELPKFGAKKLSLFNNIIQRIEKRKPKELGSLFDSNKIIPKRKMNLKKKGFMTQYNKKKDKYNMFAKEDKIIKGLLYRITENNEKDKIPKVKRIKMAFNKLYGITEESALNVNNLKNSKNLYSLDKYQDIMLKAYGKTLGQNKKIVLIQQLNKLKKFSNNIKPLPPINVNEIKAKYYNKKKKETEKENNLNKKIKGYKSVEKIHRRNNLTSDIDDVSENFKQSYQNN